MKEDAGKISAEPGGRFCKSSKEMKWSLVSSFSLGSKSTRSSRGGIECFIDDLSLHSHFLYWPIPAFFLSIILAMVIFTVLALIFS